MLQRHARLLQNADARWRSKFDLYTVQRPHLQVRSLAKILNFAIVYWKLTLSICSIATEWPTFRMDAVELFLTFPGRDVDLHQYLEFEISPHGVLFYANIKNVLLNCTETYPDKRQCSNSNVAWTAAIESSHWWAYLSVPWSALGLSGGYPEMKQRGYLWRANFYRIQLLPSGLRQFSCWSPTMSDPPCFHKPNYFGYLKLQEGQ